MFGLGEGFGVGEEGEAHGDFGEVDGFDEALGAAGFCGANDLCELDAGGHRGDWVDEPGAEVGGGLGGVAGGLCRGGFACEERGGSEGGNVEAEVEESVAVGGEGFGIGWAEFGEVGGVGVGGVGFGVGEVVVGLGEVVVFAAGVARREEGGEGDGLFGEVGVSGAEGAVAVDGGHVGARGGVDARLLLGAEEGRGEEEGGGGTAEGASGGRHGELGEGYHGWMVMRRCGGLPHLYRVRR